MCTSLFLFIFSFSLNQTSSIPMKIFFCWILYLLCPSPVLQIPIASYLCLLPDLYKLWFAVHCFISLSFLLHFFLLFFFSSFLFCFFFIIIYYFKFKLENTLDRRTSFEKFTRNVVSLLPRKTSKLDGTSFSPSPHWPYFPFSLI